ncbi:hypothetical protein WJX84_002222 [Apatococcus fuscideae]|uniref:HhH-GPD domain-containing protein n=1 Tax=Apatococcus fuscideae TaxID=2026836 RepID=A0AAW1TFH8_9CHLO
MLSAAAEQLKIRDPALGPLIDEHGAPDSLLCKGSRNLFGSLARSIVYQQLATSAADKIFQRVLHACKCAFAQEGWDKVELEDLTPASVLAVPATELRTAGLSTRKAEYIHGIAEAFSSGQLSDEGLIGMDEGTLSAELIKLRGVGQWSIDMFAMFRLGRPNILPVGDLGVRRGMENLYKLKGLPEAKEMQEIAAAWEPYRSLGSYYMWRVPAVKAASPGKKKARADVPTI